mmetsp:Transcript_33747/g.70154  ORF Transcript_33747/g.70154 Transcript_33747/m.70154 type:complete len:94 (-) Transcript_33747:1090-1371(-)
MTPARVARILWVAARYMALYEEDLSSTHVVVVPLAPSTVGSCCSEQPDIEGLAEESLEKPPKESSQMKRKSQMDKASDQKRSRQARYNTRSRS